ncbi:MAG: hypothetical protein WCF71_12125 [Verrucomicrobiia bacterium]
MCCRSLLLATPVVVAGLKPVRNFAGANYLNLAIGLPLRNQKVLTHLLREIYDPASANIRHFLKLKL